MPLQIIHAEDSPEWLEAARDIFREYAQSLGEALDIDEFDREMCAFPGDYAQPQGRLLLAIIDGAVAGCVALRPLVDVDYPNACEMRRLYVRRAFRRFGLGRALAGALIDAAREHGYFAMLLDALDEMEAARELYASLGFVEIPPYYYNPRPGAHHLKVDLTQVIVRY
jgi:putative acetyltransferase